jgi:hypothetical protein
MSTTPISAIERPGPVPRNTQGYLSYPTASEAVALGAQGMANALDRADQEWVAEARSIVLGFDSGHRFLAEEVTLQAAQNGYFTRSARALGPIIRRFKRLGVICPSGQLRPTRTSNGAIKTVWERC